MRYRIFGNTGVRLSAVALGTGNFGTGWGYGAGRDDAKAVYDAYRAVGGNFIDTANNYQVGQSEALVGEFVASDRDDVFLATKFSLPAGAGANVLSTGNSRRAMAQSVEASLRRLATDRIDLLWVHMPDFVTPVDEIARGLDDLVRAGKILYAGLSDFPAWRAAAAATLSDLRGWAGIDAIQIEYSLVERTPERELLPMASAFGMDALGWSPLGGGLLTGKYRQGETGRAQGLGVLVHAESDPVKTATVDAVLAIAGELGVTPGEVAIAWVIARGVRPIIGPRNAAQAAGNLAAADLVLTPAQVERLDRASAIGLGFPHDMLADPANQALLTAGKAELIDPLGRAVR